MNITITKKQIEDYDILAKVIEIIKEQKEKNIYITISLDNSNYEERFEKIYKYLTIIFFEHIISYHKIEFSNKYVFRFNIQYYGRALGSNKKIRAVAKEKINKIVKLVMHHSDELEEQLKFINEYFVSNYKYDYNNSICYKAIGPLFEEKGVCSGFVLLFSLIANQLNIPYVPVLTCDKEHVYVAIKINNTLKFIDFSENIANKRNNKCFMKDNYYCGLDIDEDFVQKTAILKYNTETEQEKITCAI